MFEFLKDKLILKEIAKLFFAILKVMFNTGLAKVLKEAGSMEIFEFQGSLLIGINADKPDIVKESIKKLGDELKNLKLPTCSIQFDGNVITVQFNEKHKEEMSRVVA